MTRADIVAKLEGGGIVFSIGQIETRDRAWLDRQARKGVYVKRRAAWPWITMGTCIKTAFALPGGALDLISETKGKTS